MTNTLFLLFASVSLFSCQSPSVPYDAATEVTGRYLVTAYIVSGDTLFSSLPTSAGFRPGINKIGIDNFALVVNRIGANQISVSTSYYQNGSRPTVSKELFVNQTTYQYDLAPIKDVNSSVYEGKIERNRKIFYERTVGGGLLIPVVGSPTNPNQPAPKDVVIVAEPQR